MDKTEEKAVNEVLATLEEGGNKEASGKQEGSDGSGAKKLLLFPVALIGLALSPVILVFFILAYITLAIFNPHRLALLKRDIFFIRLVLYSKKVVTEIMTETDGYYSVADAWYKALKSSKPSKKFLVFIRSDGTSESLTYAQTEKLTNRIANWAVQSGYLPGETLGLHVNNQMESIVVWLGLSKVGVRTALLNPETHGDALKHALSVCGARCVIAGSDLVGAAVAIAADLPDLPVYQVPAPGDSGGKAGAAELDFGEIEELSLKKARSLRKNVLITDTVLHIFTSGTTGLPKAARVNHMRIVSGSSAFSYASGVNKNTVFYSPLPLCHSSATILGVGGALTASCTFVFRRKFSASKFFEDCAKHKVTVIQYIGELCRFLVSTPKSKYDKTHKVQTAMGNGMRPEVWETFIKRFAIPRVVEFYASTEGNANLINVDNKLGSVGCVSALIEKQYPVRFIKVDQVSGEPVRDSKTGLCVLAEVDEPGEVVGLINQKDPTRRFDGYSERLATKKKLIANVLSTGDAWFRTGDLARKDKDGYVYFVDRIGDTFRWKGENVSTTEVALALSKASNQVAEVNVFGVQVPNHDGRAGTAAITLAPGITLDEFDSAKLLSAAQKNLPSFAIPVFLRITPEIEKTGTFKHKKVGLRNEGVNPAEVSDPLYVLDGREAKGYVTLSTELYQSILTKEFRI